MQRRGCLMACLLLLGAGCGESGGNQNNSACPEGFEQSGQACIPIFDDCPGVAEIPVLGGGCQQVGVTTCATGLFTSDGEGGCEPILPDHSCPPGTMEMLGQTECQPVGVTECAVGFESDGEGGCNAILPPDPCPSGTIALLGYTACQPLGDCGTGPWGNIVDDGTTVYVDQTADATGADGTQQAPYLTIGEALVVVLPGGQIAVAAGDYLERLTINKEVRLTGRCSELVQIVAIGSVIESIVRIEHTASQTTIRGVTVSGDGTGLEISGANGVIVEQVQVLDTSGIGIVAHQGVQAMLQRVVVAGTTTIGVRSEGSQLVTDEIVVRDTRANDEGLHGRGMQASCALETGTCGSLSVTRSLVSENRDIGLGAFGVDITVTDTVVRDTLPTDRDATFGVGITAVCYPEADSCGSLRVSSCLVQGNRAVGISIFGVDTEITASVVRDTLPTDRDATFGDGINAQCHPEAGACGSLRVSSSLVSGNRYMGIFASGVDTEVTDTVVRDTLPFETSGEYGRGVNAECDSVVGACGSLRVSSSLVSGNRDIGIKASGVETEVTATVVRETLPVESTGTNGVGIFTQCHPEAGACGSVRISSCLVQGNRAVGIFASGVETEVITTVVSDTMPNESIESSGEFGLGIAAQCFPEAGVCGNLRVSSCLVQGNRAVGIFADGVDTQVIATVVRNTLPVESTGKFGRGIGAQCHREVGACGSLQVSSSLVMGSENVGIYVAGVWATLERVAVIDTRPNAQGYWQGIDGHGIWVLCDPDTGDCGGFSMTSCLVDSSHSAGVALEGVSGFIAASVVRSVSPQPLDGKYGYGVQVGGLEYVQLPTFDITDCIIQDAMLSGVLYYRARGTISGSVMRGGENSVVMNEGSILTVLDNNELSGTVADEPTWANLYPSPAPPPSLPVE